MIPLSLLFAIVVMNALGLSGNLMSLGAIDFGLIVDGAVIIVENCVRRLSEKELAAKFESARLAIVESATLEVRSASVFGEAIIAIVYVPILALSGIEGKLFKPMATTVLLAIGGAFILSLTFVPVLTSYLVRPKAEHETRVFKRLVAVYRSVLDAAMRRRWPTLIAAGLVVVGAVLLGTTMGAEFVPQLDEGDLLIEARRLSGIALSESVETSLRLEKALREIPEVSTVVTRTGSPEVATDPMGLEQSDGYIAL